MLLGALFLLTARRGQRPILEMSESKAAAMALAIPPQLVQACLAVQVVQAVVLHLGQLQLLVQVVPVLILRGSLVGLPLIHLALIIPLVVVVAHPVWVLRQQD